MAYNRQQTEQALIDAVGQILSTSGFGGLGINAIAREAGVDKVLIYRYFDGLPALLRTYGEHSDFWPSVAQVLGDDGADLEAFQALSINERMERIVIGLFDALRERPQTIEVLAWEVLQRNELTRVLEEVRERWSEEIIRIAMPDAAADGRDVIALANLLIAGMNYLLIRSRNISVYGTLELDSPDGVERIRDAIRRACRGGFAHSEMDQPRGVRSDGSIYKESESWEPRL